MSQATVQILLPQTTVTTLTRGDKKPAAAYYLASADLQTVTWSLTGATGRITIQASLATDPVLTNDDDWFEVYTFTFSATGGTGTQNGYTNINGNYVWLRAILQGTTGVAQYIKVSYY